MQHGRARVNQSNMRKSASATLDRLPKRKYGDFELRVRGRDMTKSTKLGWQSHAILLTILLQTWDPILFYK